MPPIRIEGRPIDENSPCFVIAEAGVNHNGSLDVAHALIEAAARAGADAVKFQAFHADSLVTRDAGKAPYQLLHTPAAESHYEMLKKLELPDDAFGQLREHCRDCGVVFLCSVFDPASADLLTQLGAAAFKLGSGELTNLPLLEHVAGKGRPLILSTGMATLAEVQTALETVRAAGNDEVILLHCVSNYPAAPAEVNLRAIRTLADAFGLPTGYSDHTLGIEVAVAAVALGARILEKHFTLDAGQPGPDHAASMTPAQMAELIGAVRAVEAALGDGIKRPAAGETPTAAAARRSVVAAADLAAGTCLTRAHVALRRPGTGLPPAQLPSLLGRRLRRAVCAGALLSREMFL
ncbi:MAG: N-acetylneuraminate synthase [Kiritimatiellae bacterium]|nr:N-acetylneuraminate synthase [Kiritimatiellia bacterium]